MNRITAVTLAALVTMATLSVVVGGAGASAALPSQDAESESEAHAGAHVAFETSDDAVTNYRVDGTQVFENVTVASESGVEAGAATDLSAVTELSGIGLELGAESETRAEVRTDGSASLTVHDTDRGILTVDAGEESQYVELELAGESGAEAAGESDDRVAFESDNRSGAIVVAGDGNVTVNDDGDVTAELESESKLVFRSYDGERDAAAEEQERMIADGTATAEVYAEERDGERVTEVATYGQDIAVEAQNESEDRVEMTAERARSNGTVVIATVSEAALAGADSADDLAVTVDGEVAAEASSYSELEGGIGEESRYVVSQTSDASAAVDVLVAVDHFSERNVVIQGGESVETDEGDDESTGDGESTGDDEDDSLPGFGIAVALIAVLVAVGARVRR